MGGGCVLRLEPDEFHHDTFHAVSHGPCLHLPKKRHRGETAGEAGGSGEGRWEGQRELGCREEKGCDRYNGRGERGAEHELRRLEGAWWGHVGQGGEHEIRSQDRKVEDERGDKEKGNWGDVTVDQHQSLLRTPIMMPVTMVVVGITVAAIYYF